jgi:hypothetical protein
LLHSIKITKKFGIGPTEEQRICIKFYANLGRSATETLTIIREVSEKELISRARKFEWESLKSPSLKRSETGADLSQQPTHYVLTG